MLAPAVFLPYLLGITVLALGIAAVLRGEWRLPSQPKHAIERVVPFGPLLFAVPFAVFSGEHFTAAKAIGAAIPPWIPGHLFWAYFVGAALLAAALSIAVHRFADLAATLLGVMIFCFVVLIHWPRLMANPADRISIAVILRDLAFSAGALSLGAAQGLEPPGMAAKLIATARTVVAISLLFFGVEHFLHPGFVPVVPLELRMPAWMPFHFLWSSAAGTALLAGGLLMIVNWHARTAATALGIVVLITVLFVYAPILAAKPDDIGIGMNYFADTLAVGGNLLILARALR